MDNGSMGGLSTSLLGIAFIVLKLCHVIDWPWVWVLSPFWVSVGLVALVCVIRAILTIRAWKKRGRW